MMNIFVIQIPVITDKQFLIHIYFAFGSITKLHLSNWVNKENTHAL